ncbi:MAG: tetratricopeptide repeat protein [Opitutaceae bacterium]|jgi:predicted Zn-dependent protease
MPAIDRLILYLPALALAGVLQAAPADDVQKQLLAGNYMEAIQQAQNAVRVTPADENLQILLVRGLLTVGRYADANAAVASALAKSPQSIRLRWIGREAALANGQKDVAARMANEIRQYVATRPYLYRDPSNLVAFGEVALLLGADPKDVMDKILATAQELNAALRDVYLAKGELALEKHDFDLAAKAYQAGLKQFPDDPDFHCGLAKAYASGDRASMLAEADAALKLNPRHVPSLLLLVEHDIDSEDYGGADELLDKVLAVNPWQPEAWAFKAVIAHLDNQPATESVRRRNGLRFEPANPVVDWLIGKKLAEKYRFAEAVPYERQALQFDPAYLPAKEELANDLLRLGQEAEGWQLAEEVHLRDDYDVEAYNLSTLHDAMAKYETLANGDFVVRMTSSEAKVYGPRVLDLLGRARRKLTEKYGVELVRPTYVEIFGDQKDFAVRTFGVPDIGGFLGVCFGRVVTANGPAANSAHPTNWETVLWHEFCHVVTLQITQNKMPRWLSEGISVYEESQADPSWGMHMNPLYREMIVNGELTPIANLSGAFLVPKTFLHLQFAYYESSLFVEFLINRYGLDQLKAILRDLGSGADINQAIAAHSEPLPELEKDFAAYAKAKAEQLAPALDWKRPDSELLEPGSEQKLADWTRQHPDNYWALRMEAHDLVEAKKYPEAKAVLAHFIALYPGQTGPDSAYLQLAAVHRALGDTESERGVLEKLAAIDDNATDPCLRLMELARGDRNWPAEEVYAEKFIAVNPLVVPPYRHLAEAAEGLGDTATAIAADRTELLLNPPNPSEVHFQLARLLHRSNDPEARRQVLQSLEDAPRYREALALLLDIDRAPPAAAAEAMPKPDPQKSSR